jgi:hypothetical protein
MRETGERKGYTCFCISHENLSRQPITSRVFTRAAATHGVMRDRCRRERNEAKETKCNYVTFMRLIDLTKDSSTLKSKNLTSKGGIINVVSTSRKISQQAHCPEAYIRTGTDLAGQRFNSGEPERDSDKLTIRY